jgi:hypothetical protein
MHSTIKCTYGCAAPPILSAPGNGAAQLLARKRVTTAWSKQEWDRVPFEARVTNPSAWKAKLEEHLIRILRKGLVTNLSAVTSGTPNLGYRRTLSKPIAPFEAKIGIIRRCKAYRGAQLRSARCYSFRPAQQEGRK